VEVEGRGKSTKVGKELDLHGGAMKKGGEGRLGRRRGRRSSFFSCLLLSFPYCVFVFCAVLPLLLCATVPCCLVPADMVMFHRPQPERTTASSNIAPCTPKSACHEMHALFVSVFGSFWTPKAVAYCQTLSFSVKFYKIRWDKNHPKST
jgi:hypothetical protein